MIQERLKEIETKKLYTGSGTSIDHACVMQMVSYVAGEPWSDNPECSDPILTRFAIRINDQFNDEHRQRLKEFIPILVGTRMNDATQIARKQFLMFRYVTVTYPLIMEARKMPDIAAGLRDLPNTNEGMAQAAALLLASRPRILANAYANADANAYANADANADAYANAYADAYANADANADAYANAYAYANALREKFAATSLETLRMAIAIKVETKEN